jgi:replicative DNA helicase
MSDRPIPHSIEAERSVLGAILVSDEAVFTVGALLQPEDFHRVAHQRIYAAMQALAEAGVPSDLVMLKHELARRGDLDECGGPAYISGLADGIPRSTNVEYYARIVRDKAILRAIIATSSKAITAAYDADDDARVVLDEAERSLLALSQATTDTDLVFMDAIVPAVHAMLETIQRGGAVTGLATPWRDLNEGTRGLHPGNLVVVGGRSGEGKSALALQIGLFVAKTATAAYFSMEMSKEELTTRAIAQLAAVDHHAMMWGRLSGQDEQAVGRAIGALSGLRLSLDDTSGLTTYQIRSKAKKLQARSGLGLVIVDYLQLLQRPRHANSREEAVAENSRALKVLAGELKVPVLALSQLNRASVKEDRRPTMADLRESGAIEQDANVVLLLYKPSAQSDGVVSVEPPVELIIAKQRNGPTGTIDLYFRGPCMRFESAETRRTA